MAFFVYILASEPNGTLYIGMTDDLVKRVWQHRNDIIPGFTQRYGCSFGTSRGSRHSCESAGSRNGIELGSLR
jgi:putative endonuclease